MSQTISRAFPAISPEHAAGGGPPPAQAASPATHRRTLLMLQELSIPLIAGVVAALVWANVDHDSYEHMLHWAPLGGGVTFHFLVNDVFMALFFGIAAKEVTEACLPGGALNPPRKAVNPMLATVGGVLGPVAVYFTWVAITGDHAIARGWGVPTATDIALAWLVARLVFGGDHPAVSFLLLLAVADDGIGLGIIAIFYPDPLHPVQPIYLLVVAAAAAGAFGLRRRGVRSFWAYLLGPGVVSWVGLHMAHLHPALALVAVVPFMPSMGHDLGLFAEQDAGRTFHDTLNQFEHAFKLPVDLGLLAFGLANAGVVLASMGNATHAVLLALVIGKTTGVFTAAMIANAIGFPLPEGMNVRSLLVVGVIASLGLTVALFVAGVAFIDPGIQGAAKMGALMSAAAAPIAIALGRILEVKRPRPTAGATR